ncbi:MAG TPA: hypothetical protein VGM63_21760 [Mucilaginibacter sp.]
MAISSINIKPIIGIFFALILIGCRNSLQDKPDNAINRGCGTQSNLGCKIKIKEETVFKWDKMYLLGPWTTSNTISNRIGFEYNRDISAMIPSEFCLLMAIK